jgi:hypothetical protein
MSRETGLAWQPTPAGYVGALCDGPPEQVVFEALVQWARQRSEPIAGLVIQDLRGGLDAARSDCLRRLSDALDAPIAVLTDSPLLRGAAACRWLGERVCAFGAHDRDGAFEELAVPAPEREVLRSALRALQVAHKLTRNSRRRSAKSESSAA